MKKKIMGVMTCLLLTVVSVTPAFAWTSPSGISGSFSLSKNTTSATGKTAYGVGKSVTATRYVKVSLTCTKSGKSYTYTDDKTAVTNTGNYSSTTASMTVYKPSSSYSVKSAKSSHKVTAGSWSTSDTITK